MRAFAHLERFLSGGVLRRALRGGDFDALLDARDEPDFEIPWMEADKRVDQLVREQPLPEEESMAVDAVRESVYKEVYRLTEHPELAGCISDDFGLLAKAMAYDLSDPTINALFYSYSRGVVPETPPEPLPGRIVEMVTRSA